MTCTRCGKEVKQGQWDCPLGGRHTVPPKTYYIRTEGLHYFWRNEQLVMGPDGKAIPIPPQKGAFKRGITTVNDPEHQLFLDNYGPCCSAEEWEKTHLSVEEQNAKTEREIVAKKRQLQELDEQLARARAMVEESKVKK